MKKNVITISLIVISVLFITFGIYRGDAKDVYKKATKICFECIGIG